MKLFKQKTLAGLIPILILLFCASINAEPDDQKNSLKKFSRSLQFRLISNVSDSSSGKMIEGFQGFTLSGKFHLSNRDALRLGFTFTHIEYDRNIDYFSESSQFDTMYMYSFLGIEDKNDYRRGIDIQYLRYISDSSPANLFIGFGPYMNFDRILIGYMSIWPSLEDNESPGADTGSTFFYQDYMSTGLTGVIGIEWFLWKPFSLHAEYGLSLEYKWSRDIDQYYTDDSRLEIKKRKYSVYNNPIKLGISVYF